MDLYPISLCLLLAAIIYQEMLFLVVVISVIILVGIPYQFLLCLTTVFHLFRQGEETGEDPVCENYQLDWFSQECRAYIYTLGHCLTRALRRHRLFQELWRFFLSRPDPWGNNCDREISLLAEHGQKSHLNQQREECPEGASALVVAETSTGQDFEVITLPLEIHEDDEDQEEEEVCTEETTESDEEEGEIAGLLHV